MMRKTRVGALVVVIAVLVIGVGSVYGKEDPKYVEITYSKPVEDHDVKIHWRPYEVMCNHLIGPAILEFTNKKTGDRFFLTNNRFGLPTSLDWFKTVKLNKGYYEKTSQPSLVLDYTAPEFTAKLPSNSFFFVDLTFDGKKELVVTEIANGQRWRHTYKVYDPEKMGTYTPIAATEPFCSLDSESVIDRKNRTIRIHNSGGASVYDILLYRFDDKHKRYLLKEFETRDGNKYAKYTVSVDSRKLLDAEGKPAYKYSLLTNIPDDYWE
jgi:hypothetical protein